MIDTENLTKEFGNLIAVEDLTLHVDEGEVFGFLGPNGAGKTMKAGVHALKEGEELIKEFGKQYEDYTKSANDNTKIKKMLTSKYLEKDQFQRLNSYL